jgi:TatD DNase family protein
MTWIDTHCHLDQPALFEKIERVIKNSIKSDIEGIVVPSVSPENVNEVINISQRFDLCSLALGFHPFFSDRVKDEDFKILSLLLIEHDAVAVGEIGLDKFLDNIPLNTQEKVFKNQLDIADDLELPIIVHARGMIDLITKYIREKKIKGGIIHAFNGSFQQAEQLIKLGFKLGFGGVITYERARHVRSLAQNLPIEAIVLETDAPDMNPSWLENILPNEPAQLKKISQIFCKLRGLDTEVIADTLRRNTIEALPKLGRLYT